MASKAYARRMNPVFDRMGVVPGAKTGDLAAMKERKSSRVHFVEVLVQGTGALAFASSESNAAIVELPLGGTENRPIPLKCAARSPRVTLSQATVMVVFEVLLSRSGIHLLTGSDQCCSPASMRKSHVVKNVVKSPMG